MNKSGSYPLLDTINSPADVRKLKKDQLKPLAKELRDYLTHTVSISGGHFSAGLICGLDVQGIIDQAEAFCG